MMKPIRFVPIALALIAASGGGLMAHQAVSVQPHSQAVAIAPWPPEHPNPMCRGPFC